MCMYSEVAYHVALRCRTTSPILLHLIWRSALCVQQYTSIVHVAHHYVAAIPHAGHPPQSSSIQCRGSI